MKRLPLLLFLVFPVAGCGGAASTRTERATRPPKPALVAPAPDEPKWLRFQSEHFDLATDLNEEEASLAAETLEATRSAMLAAAWPGSPDTVGARTNVIVFAEAFDYIHFFDKSSAIFVPFVRPTIVLFGKPDYWEQKTGLNAEASSSHLRHELTHRIASSIFAREPRWFAEGLAQYFETITVSPDGTTATVGEMSPDRLRSYKQHRLSVKDALEWRTYDKDEESLVGLYGLSWLLVHFLYDNRPREFATFQHALMRGVAPERAWSQAFGATSLDALDAHLWDYAQRRSFKKSVVPIERAAVKRPTRATITAADVHAIRAQLAIAGQQSRERAYLRDEVKTELRRALTLEPANPLAIRILRAEGKRVSTRALVARLREQIAKRPDDGEAWLLLAEVGDGSEREAAARKALDLMPTSADAHANLAWELATKGRADEALALAKKAIMLAPWQSRVFEIYATVLAEAGRCVDAVQAQSRAIELLSDSGARSTYAERMRHQLDDYKRACGAGRKRRAQ